MRCVRSCLLYFADTSPLPQTALRAHSAAPCASHAARLTRLLLRPDSARRKYLGSGMHGLTEKWVDFRETKDLVADNTATP